MKRNPLMIGNLKARIPVIQGGMGVGISLSGLASAVASCGGIGVISSAQIGCREADYDEHPLEANLRAVKKEILRARTLSPSGILGVNIMTADEFLFFNIMPNALPLYEILRSKLLTECPNTSLKVQKSQITFKAKYGYAFVSLKRMKGCPEVFIIVSFGLSHRLNSPRIAIAVEPYPNRWTHHMIVFEAEQLDDELIGWLREAYDFAQTKERRSSL